MAIEPFDYECDDPDCSCHQYFAKKKEESGLAGQIAKLEIKPGDRLVLFTDRTLTQEQHQFIKGTLEKFAPEGTNILVLDSGAKLAVLSTDELEKG